MSTQAADEPDGGGAIRCQLEDVASFRDEALDG
jgi:hypothetical protein